MNKLINSILNSRLSFWKQKKIKNDKGSDRQKNILRILLTSFMIMAAVAQVLSFIHNLTNLTQGKTTNFILSPAIAFIFFFVLFKLTTINKTKIAAFLFLLVLFLLIFKSSMAAGIDNPQTIVIYSLIITMSGILVSPKFSLISTSLICLFLLVLFLLQQNGVIQFSNDWKKDTFETTDALVLLSSYMVIAIVSWLFSHEIIVALKKARKSEKEALNLAKELQKEKDSLEIKVADRTKELKDIQLRELTKISNLAEFGKLSAGLLHDIKNPLTVISLNLDSLRSSPKSKTIELINRSLLAAKTAEIIIKSSQNQLSTQEEKQVFDLILEIRNTLKLTEHMADKEQVQILLDAPKKLILNGYPSKISRVIANLVMNAIDSFEGIERDQRLININVIKNKVNIIIEITDNGCGIKDEDKSQLFQLMFSKKKNGERMGLGLYSSKKIMKDYFGGDIVFESSFGVGTKFSVIIPEK